MKHGGPIVYGFEPSLGVREWFLNKKELKPCDPVIFIDAGFFI